MAFVGAPVALPAFLFGTVRGSGWSCAAPTFRPFGFLEFSASARSLSGLCQDPVPPAQPHLARAGQGRGVSWPDEKHRKVVEALPTPLGAKKKSRFFKNVLILFLEPNGVSGDQKAVFDAKRQL